MSTPLACFLSPSPINTNLVSLSSQAIKRRRQGLRAYWHVLWAMEQQWGLWPLLLFQTHTCSRITNGSFCGLLWQENNILKKKAKEPQKLKVKSPHNIFSFVREIEISIRIIFTFLPSNQLKFKPRLVQIKRGRELGLGKRRRDTLRKKLKLIRLRNISLPDEMTPRWGEREQGEDEM